MLESGTPDAPTRLRTLVALSRLYLEVGDVQSATPIVREAARLEHCVMPAWAIGTPEWRNHWQRSRPPGATCDVSVVRATAKSMVFPGWGLHESGRRGAATTWQALAIAAGAFAGYQRVTAGTAYAEYREAVSPFDAVDAYDRAKAAYDLALLGAGVTAVLWVVNVVHTFDVSLKERRRLAPILRYEHDGPIESDGRLTIGLRLGGLR